MDVGRMLPSTSIRNWTTGKIGANILDGLTPQTAAISAQKIKEDTATNTNGIYWINISGTPVQVYCMMDSSFSGGGWMLCMRGQGTQQYGYGNSAWTDSTEYSASELLSNTHGTFAKNIIFFGYTGSSRIIIDAGGFSGNSADGQYRQMEFVFNGTNSPNGLMFSTSNYLSSGPTYSTWRSTFGHDRTSSPFFQRYGSGANSAYGNRSLVGCGQPMMFGFQANDGPNDVNSGMGTNSNYCGGGGNYGFAGGSWMGNGGFVKIWTK